jgi:hypothetical protein
MICWVMSGNGQLTSGMKIIRMLLLPVRYGRIKSLKNLINSAVSFAAARGAVGRRAVVPPAVMGSGQAFRSPASLVSAVFEFRSESNPQGCKHLLYYGDEYE